MIRINNKIKLGILILVLSLAGVTTFGVVRAYAQTPTGGPFQSIIQKLAQRFGLNETDVKAVFDEVHTKRLTQMDALYERRLTDAVQSGKLTETQKSLLIDKHKELQAKRQSDFASGQTMTFEQRKSAMQLQKQELQLWAQQNNIDLSYLFGRHKGIFRGMRGGWHMK